MRAVNVFLKNKYGVFLSYLSNNICSNMYAII